MKVVFLDRDGVINKQPPHNGYIKSWKEFKFISGSIEAIRRFNINGFKVFIVSNQSGVAKGLYTQKDLDIITKNMLSIFKKKGAYVDGVYYCTHRTEDNCNCKKPKVGLLEKAVYSFKDKIEKAFLIGDSSVDMETAKNFNAISILVLSGKEKISNRANWNFKPDYVFDNLLVASYYLCKHYV